MLRLWWWNEITHDERPNNTKANIQAFNTQANNNDIVQAHYTQAYLDFWRISQTHYTKANIQANSNSNQQPHHRLSHDQLSHHGLSHHGLSHHGLSHHGFSHHGLTHHQLSNND
jgi:hypothetical protein